MSMSMENAVPPSAGSASSSLRDLHARSDDELDALAYGVIALDRKGTILRYNLAEARFARLDRNQVLGQSFFEKVAPCTATPGFLGRFQSFSRPGNVEPLVRFQYVFDFRFGAQQVDVELVRTPSADVIYLCIDRRKMLPVRREVELPPGIEQKELSPDEDKSGVLRDQEQRRIVHASGAFLDALWITGQRLSPELWPRIAEEWGFSWGRRAVVEMEVEALESFDRLLTELPIVTVFEVVARTLRRDGWGALTADFTTARSGLFVVRLQRNALAEASGREGRSACAVFSGFFRAILSHLSDRRVGVREVRCASTGAAACEFAVVAEARLADLEAAMPIAAGDLRVLSQRLGER